MNVQSDCWMQGAKIPNVERNVKIPDWVETNDGQKKEKRCCIASSVHWGYETEIQRARTSHWESITKRFGGDDFNACLVNTI